MDYTVDVWGSQPVANDDCWAGEKFASLGEAEEFLASVMGELEKGHRVFNGYCGNNSIAYLVLDGPDAHREICNKFYKPTPVDYSADRSEAAMQAGMAFGCDGYNDMMGY